MRGSCELRSGLYSHICLVSFTLLIRSKPEGEFSFQQLKDTYYPGDVGFDPLNLKPTDADEFATIQTKELQNGRLAMLGAAGMIAQELVK